MSRAEAKLGLAGQKYAADALRRLGVLMVEEIGTPFTILRTLKIKGAIYYQGFFGEKVSGDLRGHTKQGISVLAEVKTIWDRNLRWSDLRDHQPERLDIHAERAISLLVWVHYSGIFVMDWQELRRLDRFGPGGSITPEQAAEWSLEKQQPPKKEKVYQFPSAQVQRDSPAEEVRNV